MMRPVTYLLAVMTVALVACSPQQKLARLLTLHPELAVNDTIRDTIRITVPGETVMRTVEMRSVDTVYLDSGRVHVQLIRVPTGSPCDTAVMMARLQARCDTVYIEHPYEKIVEKLVPCPPAGVRSWWRVVAIVLGLVCLILIWFKR